MLKELNCSLSLLLFFSLEEEALRQKKVSEFKKQIAELPNEGSALKEIDGMKQNQQVLIGKNEDEKGRLRKIPKDKRLKGKSLRF